MVDDAIIDHLVPGSFFGEGAILSAPGARPIVLALAPARVIVFSGKALVRVVRSALEVAAVLFEQSLSG